MLAGTPAFPGTDVADTMASVLKTTPNWEALPADVPPHVVTLIQQFVIRSLSPFQFDPPRRLFTTRSGEFDSTTPIRGSDAAADGQRFLMNKPIATTDKPVTEMHVVLNWVDDLRRRVPAR